MTEQPTKGGSYIRQKNGKLDRVEHTKPAPDRAGQSPDPNGSNESSRSKSEKPSRAKKN